MGEALFDLEQVLRSQKETLTHQEMNILQSCKSKAVRQFTFGVLTGATVAWAATWKLSWFARANISGGAAIFFGFWRFGKSLDSGVDHILAMDGSRMQKELANIMVNKYRDDPWTMQHLNRRFYSEKVFDDSNLHMPILSLQYRNSFGDNVAYGQRTHDSDSHDASHSDSDIKRDDVESKKVPARIGIYAKSQNHSFRYRAIQGFARLGMSRCAPMEKEMNLGAKVMEDPLESIFGFMAPVEEIHHLGTSGKPARVLNRSHKRSHRRHWMRHQEASLNSERLQPQQI
ncbi:hypothetical protein NC653_024965 [Populus alba x Populus x berolinensis]|uniref:Uncharacterized protein n=1 Tax=Populus alba x Populus x berolinensis TaxID=444605 RepID=A0AAD6MA18_9ROSI|nr:hypothetical protein NC653_024965 [Populus alba x Populus x berolinensis]